jgi:hypothetical protein
MPKGGMRAAWTGDIGMSIYAKPALAAVAELFCRTVLMLTVDFAEEWVKDVLLAFRKSKSVILCCHSHGSTLHQSSLCQCGGTHLFWIRWGWGGRGHEVPNLMAQSPKWSDHLLPLPQCAV